MKLYYFSRIFLVMLSSAVLYSLSAEVESPFEVGTWGNFCKGAISHTFDDNTTNQTGSGQAAFDEYGFHMTLFTVTGSMNPNWEKLKAAFAKGHEIASHSVTHAQTMPVSELSPSQKTIQEKIPGEKCATIAYPNCNTPGDKEVVKYYIAGRNCNGQINSKSPTNWAQIGSKMFGSCGGCPNDANSMNSYADQAASQNGWATTCHHGIGNESHGWAVTNLNAVKDHLKYLDQNRDKIWIETFGNVARYIKERDAASVKVQSSDENNITIEVTHNLGDDSIFNYPLSIRRPLPDGWTQAEVIQDEKEVEDTIITVDSKKYVMFKAVPNGGDVVISSGVDAVGSNKLQTLNGTANVRIDNNTVHISTSGSAGRTLSIRVFNLKGVELAAGRLRGNETSFVLPKNKITASPLIVELNESGTLHTMKIMPQL